MEGSTVGIESNLVLKAEKARTTIDDEYEQKIKNMHELIFQSKQFFDVQLAIRNSTETIAAHRMVLAASSELLREEFLAKPQQAVFTFDIEDIESLKTLIRFCYSGEMVLTEQNAPQIAITATLLKMWNAMSMYFKYISTQLNVSNSIRYLAASRYIGLAYENFATKYVVEHFTEIIEDKSFVLLNTNELSEFLRIEDLPIDSEEYLFRALMKWYRHDTFNRQGAMKDMLPLIRFGDFSPEFIKETAAPILTKVGCQDLLVEALLWHLPGDKPITTSFATNSRNGTKTQTRLIAVVCGGSGVVETYGYNAHLKLTGEHVSFSIGVNLPLLHVVDCFLKSKLILFFGRENIELVYEADLKTQSVCKIPSPNSLFEKFDVIVINNKMYVLGLYVDTDKGTKNGALECYNPDDQKWTSLPLMLPLQENFSASCLQNQLFVAYKDGFKSVICNTFDPETQLWSEIKSPELGATMPGFIRTLSMGDELHVSITDLFEFKIKAHKYDVKSENWTKIAFIDIKAHRIKQKLFYRSGDNYFMTIFPINATMKYDKDEEKWIEFNHLDVSAIGNKEIFDFVSLNN